MQKFIALLLSLVMLLSLAACGGTESTEVEIDTTTATGIGTDLQWDGSLPLTDEATDNVITIGLRPSANVLDYETNEFTLWLEEQTGLDLQFVQFSGNAKDASTQVSLMIAGGEKLPDILMGFNGIGKAVAKEYGRDGYFANMAGYFATDAYYMTEALHTYYPEEADFELISEQLMITILDPISQGIYNYPVLYQNPADNLLAQMWINQVWLDNLGLTAPTTVEELYDVLVAFRDNDPNGNGRKDEIPMVGRDGATAQDLVGWIINAFLYYNPTYKFNVENGKIYTPYDQDEYRQALIYMKKLVDEKLLDPMTWTMSNAELQTLINPLEDFTVGVITGSADERFETDHESIHQYVPLAPLADATGKGGYGAQRLDTIHYYTFITTDCDNPRQAFRFLDFLCSQEAYLRGRWGVEGVNWDYADETNTLPGAGGGEARLIIHGDDAFMGINNQNWHAQQSICSGAYWQYALDLSDGSWKATMYNKLNQQKENYAAAGQPEELVYNLPRNDAEEEIFQEHNSDLNSFVATARANFCTGITNPENDTDWQAYLNDLYAMGYQESWIDVAQGGYDRTH